MADLYCTVYGAKHRMLTNGTAFGFDYRTNKRILSGGLYKCKCGERVLAEGGPHLGAPLRRYITEGGFREEGTVIIGGVSGYNIYPEHIHETTDSSIPGYEFYPAG